MSKWKIFYDDGSTYTDQDGAVESAPKRGVQGIVLADDMLGRRTEHGSDFYIHVPDRGFWRGVDHFGLFDYLIDPGFKVILFGRTLSDADYRCFWKLMLDDRYLPPKSAIGHNERKP